MAFEQLPLEIQHLILGHVTVDDVYSLRLVNRHFEAYIQDALNNAAPHVAHNWFSVHSRHLFDPLEDGRYGFSWLQIVQLRYLAAILIDRRTIGWDWDIYSGSPALRPEGDKLRSRVTNGLRIACKLSITLRQVPVEGKGDVYQVTSQQVKYPTKRKWLRGLGSFIDCLGHEQVDRRYAAPIEHDLPNDVLKFLEMIPAVDASDWVLFHYLLSETVTANQGPHPDEANYCRLGCTEAYINPLDAIDPFDWGSGGHELRFPRTWVNWSLMYAGPLLLWSQWSRSLSEEPESCHIIARAVEDVCKIRAGHQLAIETVLGQKVQLKMYGKAGVIENDRLQAGYRAAVRSHLMRATMRERLLKQDLIREKARQAEEQDLSSRAWERECIVRTTVQQTFTELRQSSTGSIAEKMKCAFTDVPFLIDFRTPANGHRGNQRHGRSLPV